MNPSQFLCLLGSVSAEFLDVCLSAHPGTVVLTVKLKVNEAEVLMEIL